MTQSADSHSGALSHIRICDFTGQLAGAGATRILATFGAQVIRIEDRVTNGKWDILRGNPPYPPGMRGNEVGGAFNNHNVEKLGVTLNMRTAKGRELLRKLIAVSDVVAENFSAGVMERWGFTYDRMAVLRPDLIYVSNSGFGHEGPYSTFKTWGPIVQAVSGLTFQSGLPGLPPAGWGYSYMDHTGAYFMAIAILAALYHRARTGQGQWVDMSCTDAAATLNGPALLDYTANSRPLRRPGRPHSNRHNFPVMAPHGIYRCRGDDQWVAIAARDDRDWHAICDVLGHPEWKEDPRFRDVQARITNLDALDRLIEAWTTLRDPRDVMDALQARGVPAAMVQHPEDRVDHDANTAHWGLWPEVEHPQMGRVRVDGVPIKLSATPAELRHGAPTLGQHNEPVFCGILGLNAEELASLEQEEVV
ncbi:MAG: CoA transferase [SAR202 cluster bacterium]|nr:CoA transferase [SAR202 cluster bacterium]